MHNTRENRIHSKREINKREHFYALIIRMNQAVKKGKKLSSAEMAEYEKLKEEFIREFESNKARLASVNASMRRWRERSREMIPHLEGTY